jgi:hypothetical protein
VNPVNDDVYALGQSEFSGEPSIFSYSSTTGEPVGSCPVPASDNFSFFEVPIITVVGIAADSAGNVYVPVVPKNEVWEYSPTGEELKKFKGGSGASALNGPTGVAVDPAGNVWVVDAGNDRIVELSPSDTVVQEIAGEGVQSVAVDPHGDVFAIVRNNADFCGSIVPPCPHLLEYSSTGVRLADLGAGSIGAEAAQEQTEKHLPDMVAVNDATGRVYVTEGVLEPRNVLHSRVFKYTPPVAPKLEGELAVEVGVSEAKLGAVVNPGGISAAYRFEYGMTAAYGNTVPFPEGDTGGGFQPRTVWAGALGLQPGTTYHYRVVVTGELGEPVVGDDRTFTTRTPVQAGCPNEQFRTSFSASLPDCRAYELVTPPNKAGAVPDPVEKGGGFLEHNFAGIDGNRMAFQSEDVFPGSKSGGRSYVATRGSTAWSSENMFPSAIYHGFECPNTIFAKMYSTDLSKAIIELGGDPECDIPEPELVAGEPKGVNNLYLRDNTNGSYQLINMAPPGVTGASAELLAASADLGHVLFREQAPLTPDALGGVPNEYEWANGALRLLRMALPDGTPVAGELKRLSHDGSRVFFTYAGGLYAQGAGRTVQLDAAQAGGTGGGGSLVSVSADGSHAFVTDANRLTADSTAEPGKQDLYRYDFASPEGERLTDLTVDPGEPANVQQVRGVSEDGSYVYFEADGVLPGTAANANGETAQAGQPNLYVWRGGRSTFIATQVSIVEPTAELVQVTANGAFLALASTKRLTGYENVDANTGQRDSEIYLYSAADNALLCASCNPSGEPPTGPVALEARAPRNVSDNGQVFFDSTEALLPADTNGRPDVYEFEPGGVGSCSDLAGCVSLLSSGTGSRPTTFIEASPSGNDVFLLENQKLLPQDRQEELQTIYDVRVNGGIREPAAPRPCTTADACRTAPAPQPSIFGVPASQTFSSAGNLTPAAPPPPAKPKPKQCRKGYVKKKNKCVKSKAKKGKKARKNNRKGSK